MGMESAKNIESSKDSLDVQVSERFDKMFDKFASTSKWEKDGWKKELSSNKNSVKVFPATKEIVFSKKKWKDTVSLTLVKKEGGLKIADSYSIRLEKWGVVNEKKFQYKDVVMKKVLPKFEGLAKEAESAKVEAALNNRPKSDPKETLPDIDKVY